MKCCVRKFPGRWPRDWVLSTEPLTQPLASMAFHGSVGFADWPETEVVRPPDHRTVELLYHPSLVQQDLIPSGHLANRLADAHHPLLRRNRPQVGTPRLRRIASTKRVSQKVELLFRQFADPRLRFIHRQLQLRHDVSHPSQRFFRLATAADHQVIGVVNDVCSKTLLVSELLPSQHESTHVHVAEQRADRSSLWGSPSLIPIARTPMLIPFLVSLFNRNFQPHLDQMQHCSVDDPSSHRLEKVGMRNAIEVAA